jgi:hypothetical protein
MKIIPIQRATLLGATPFKNGNVTDTYRGQIALMNGLVKYAYIKDIDQRELGIELLISAVGRLLGYPVPNGYLTVSNLNLPTSVGPKLPSGETLKYASEDAQSPPLTSFLKVKNIVDKRILRRLLKMDAAYGLFPFDTWTANVDRNTGNLLVSGEGLWYIDHGRCFGGPAVAPHELDSSREYPQKITSLFSTVMVQEEREKALQLCNSFAGESQGLIVKSLLGSTDIQAVLGAANYDLFVEFLEGRKQYVPKLGASLLDRGLLI